MPKTREQKEATVKALAEDVQAMKSAVFASFSGLTVKETEELRQKCRAEDVKYLVTKKTLLKLALDKGEIEGVDVKELPGNLATAFGFSDEVAAARVLNDFAKDHEGLELLGGVMEARFLAADEIKGLAQLPSKAELLAKVVGSIKAPVSGLVNVMAGNLRGLVQVLDAIKEAKI